VHGSESVGICSNRIPEERVSVGILDGTIVYGGLEQKFSV
jgi:hypothetical protein